ncbi:hypothetical protein J31TS4_28890 [Paenibacillus sp. J31TS4]|uniref:hypothetical protein n=1 Tax=Paenibacillus sp. J31TS4 TaxID=2807195 RepID=UPI001B2F7452|nr:hypothetical protein [Paenibacillus sp. J31TS4]GIP39609.1 hypothetical protein J31TS4_28890 [Paenibacillus sp. J31TS4]
MAIIEFLLRHYYLLFIVFVLFSMLKPRKDEQQGKGRPGRPPSSMPPFGQGPGRTLARRGDAPRQAAPQGEARRAAGDSGTDRPAHAERPAAAERPEPADDGRWSELSGRSWAEEERRAAGAMPAEGSRPAAPARPRPAAAAGSDHARQRPLGAAPEAPFSGDRPVPSAEDARRGLMWAEVLGPPRARRPHRR